MYRAPASARSMLLYAIVLALLSVLVATDPDARE